MDLNLQVFCKIVDKIIGEVIVFPWRWFWLHEVRGVERSIGFFFGYPFKVTTRIFLRTAKEKSIFVDAFFLTAVVLAYSYEHKNVWWKHDLVQCSSWHTLTFCWHQTMLDFLWCIKGINPATFLTPYAKIGGTSFSFSGFVFQHKARITTTTFLTNHLLKKFAEDFHINKTVAG